MTGDLKKTIEGLASYADGLKVQFEIKQAVEKQERIHPQPVPYYRFFYHLSKLTQPDLSVELGTNHGVAAACLAISNPAGKVITLDIEYRDIFEGCELSNIEFLRQNSLDKVPLKENKVIDLLFIDTSSKGSQNLNEFMHWLPYVKPGGIIFIDDIFITSDHKGPIPHDDLMRDMWESGHFKRYGEQVVLPLHGENGFGAVILYE